MSISLNHVDGTAQDKGNVLAKEGSYVGTDGEQHAIVDVLFTTQALTQNLLDDTQHPPV